MTINLKSCSRHIFCAELQIEMQKQLVGIIKSESSEKDKNSSVLKYQKDVVVGWSVVDAL